MAGLWVGFKPRLLQFGHCLHKLHSTVWATQMAKRYWIWMVSKRSLFWGIPTCFCLCPVSDPCKQNFLSYWSYLNCLVNRVRSWLRNKMHSSSVYLRFDDKMFVNKLYLNLLSYSQLQVCIIVKFLHWPSSDSTAVTNMHLPSSYCFAFFVHFKATMKTPP